jgi:transposase
MKPTEIDLKILFSEKYLMPDNMLKVYLEQINLAMPEKMIGRKRSDLERIFHGIYYVLKTGIPWQALSRSFGSKTSVHHWFSILSQQNFFEKPWGIAIDKLQECATLNLQHQSIDTAHQKAPCGGQLTGASPVDRAKTGSKFVIHTEAAGLPIGLFLAPANRNDQKLLQPVFLDTISRIRQMDSTFAHADRGFDSKDNVNFLKMFGIKMVVPPRKYKKRKKLQLDREPDRWRWVVERTISWLGRCKRVFIRCDKIANHYLSWLQLAAQRLCFARL